MPVAFIPSPSQGVWHMGPLPVRAYALCMVAGIIVAVWVAGYRYRRAGGRPGVILDVATWAVPCGLAGARLYSVLTDYELYFGKGRDWLGIFKMWDGGMGLPGAIAAGALGSWFACRRAGVSPVAVAGGVAAGLPFGLAIGAWGNWFSQQLYGRPSALPWAVEISPAHRLPGYENYATFQPTFLYQSGWDVLAGFAVIWAARRFMLSGDRALALFLAVYCVGSYETQSLRIDYSHHVLGLRVNQWVAVGVLAWAVSYLYLTRRRRRPDRTAARAGMTGGPGPLGPRSGRGWTRRPVAGEVGSGQRVAGRVESGQRVPGGVGSGQRVAGRVESGQRVPGGVGSGQRVPGQHVPGREGARRLAGTEQPAPMTGLDGEPG